MVAKPAQPAPVNNTEASATQKKAEERAKMQEKAQLRKASERFRTMQTGGMKLLFSPTRGGIRKEQIDYERRSAPAKEKTSKGDSYKELGLKVMGRKFGPIFEHIGETKRNGS
jgi:hypothetical protein